jgi:hypothetical protein
MRVFLCWDFVLRSKLRTQLTQALDHSTLPSEELLAYIGRFQTEITKVFLRVDN